VLALEGSNMEKVIVAEIGIEGGGMTIDGSKMDGVWSFWSEGKSIDLDENDREVWRSWSSEPVSSLDLVLPKDWPVFYPVKIHPDLVGWFRTNYDAARASLQEEQRRYQDKHRHRRWSEVLGTPCKPGLFDD
jgi:hypothetical protein